MAQLPINHFILDVDGTVWDSEPDVFRSFNHVLRTQRDVEIDKGAFQKLAGMPLERMFATVLSSGTNKLSDADADRMASSYKHYYLDEGHFADETQLFPNVADTLETLQQLGCKLTIASSKPARVLNQMVAHFSLPRFAAVLGTEESDINHKPDPEIVYRLLALTDTSKAETVIIGDSKSDIGCGKSAGIATVAVTYGFDSLERLKAAEPDHFIDDFSQLMNILSLS